MDKKLIASSSPHIRSEETVSRIMLDVIIALLPATLASIYFFRFNAVKHIVLAIGAAVLTEYVIQKLLKKPVTINDFSAVVTGLLLAFNLPPTAPWWIPIVGSVFAIAIVKQAFGGLGHNFMNPALGARAMLLASWPSIMTTWVKPGPDAVTTATPLARLVGESQDLPLQPLSDVFLGNIGGCIGETSAALLILGGLYLLYRGVINWRIPVSYIGTVAVLALVFDGGFVNMSYHLFAGGLMLGAIYMATDYASSPVTPKGQLIFGIGAGIITILIRLKGGYPEGVSYSILLMNVAAPIIDKYTSPKVFGEVKQNA
ncbi:RnfABCDGE type electron transport complex subunit D [Caldisalinibacter kiritimatiensis]|uniref:Ion-translocating oxidoreductase complex subunit D n=1 Tax=Caldisalinibacter kiritimatiensis TaxID=1304284 RepID=R1ARR1_9FIRM|nr:RnfABCDGE type electron transport complex subunit D [Caldisalinibacter kiritimatiensis]EOC99837.1 Electron transport complex protein RnfD [Caldisalinibacter kiritimatiensis]